MNRKGSITIFLSLMLTIMISLVCTSILSVRVSACRMQLANAADQAMFSLFAQYDRDLLEKYDVFFVDGSCGSPELRLGKCYDRLTDAMSYLLNPNKGNIFGGRNLFSLEMCGGSIKGYTLSTDMDGAPFAAQAVDFMKETAPLQGIRILSDIIRGNSETVKVQEASGKAQKTENIQSSYGVIKAESDRIRAERAAAAAAAAKAREEAIARGETPPPEPPPEQPVQVPPGFESPMGEIVKVSAMSILNLVCQDAGAVSKKNVKTSGLLSGRTKEGGMGILDVRTSLSDTENSFWFNEYILSHYGTFRSPSADGALAYQAEYAVAGRTSDIKNLESVAMRLLLVREGVNILLIATNPSLKSQASATADIVASMLLLPEIAPALEAIIIAGWALCESIVDVRGLLDGDRIPLIKNTADWQLQLSDVPGFTSRMDSFRRKAKTGASYEDYLRIFLFLTNSGDRVSRAMDMTESTIRALGREDFRLDCCFDSLAVEMKADAEKRMEFTTEKMMCYRSMAGNTA